MGAWLALGLVLAWRLHHPFLQGLRALRTWSVSRPGFGEGPPRWALPMLVIGFAGMLLFGIVAGMSGWLVVLFFGIFLLLSLGVARVRAEFAPVHMLYYTQPEWMLANLLGVNALGRRNLTALTSFYWLNRVQIHNPAPFQLEALQLSDRTGLAGRSAAELLLVGGVVATLVVFGGYLHFAYRDGAEEKFAAFHARWSGPESFGRLETWLTAGTSGRQSVHEAIGVFLGVGIIAVLFALRRTLAWCPFHPAGYALAMDIAMTWYWFPFALAWAIKLPVIRYLGIRGYRKSEAAAMGLIAGDFLIRAFFAGVSPLFGTVIGTW